MFLRMSKVCSPLQGVLLAEDGALSFWLEAAAAAEAEEAALMGAEGEAADAVTF